MNDSKAEVPLSGTGLGYRTKWYKDLVRDKPALGFLELLAENHFARGGPARWQARQLAEHYPVTLHCVGMSLGSLDRLDATYLYRLRQLANEVGAVEVSDHIAFTRLNGVEYHDLLPLPGTEEALAHLCTRVGEAQDRLGRRLLLENASRYLPDVEEAIPEQEFMQALCERTGCGLLLDINNLYVNQHNVQGNARRVIQQLSPKHVGYVHIAGHEKRGKLLLDSHAAEVPGSVWDLLFLWLERSPDTPVLIERDGELPPLSEQLQQVAVSESLRSQAQTHAA